MMSVATLIPDCIGHVVSFLCSSRTFFRVLQTNSEIYDHFHSYGASSCENITFRVTVDHCYLKEEYFRGKPYILSVQFEGSYTLKRHYEDWTFLSAFENLRKISFDYLKNFDPHCLGNLSASSRMTLEEVDYCCGGLASGTYDEQRFSELQDLFPRLRNLLIFSGFGEEGRACRVSENLSWQSVAFSGICPSSFGFLRSTKTIVTLKDLALQFDSSGNQEESQNEFLSLLSSLQSLTSLCLSGLCHLSQPSLEKMFEDMPAELGSLNLECTLKSDGTGFTRSMMERLSTPLFTLILRGFDAAEDFLFGLPTGKLKFLSLSGMKCVDLNKRSSAGRGEIQFEGLIHLHDSLEHVSLFGFEEGNIDLKGLNLKSLAFYRNSGRWNWDEVFRSNPQLEGITIFGTDDSGVLESLTDVTGHLSLKNVRIDGLTEIEPLVNRLNPEILTRLELTVSNRQGLDVTDDVFAQFPSLEEVQVNSHAVNGSFLVSLSSLKCLTIRGDFQDFSLEGLARSIQKVVLRRLCLGAEALVLPRHCELREVLLDFLYFRRIPKGKSVPKFSDIRLPAADHVELVGFDLSDLTFQEEMFGRLRVLIVSGASPEQEKEILNWCHPQIVKFKTH